MRKEILLFYLKIFKRLNTPFKIANFSFCRYQERVFIIQPEKGLEITYSEVARRVEKIAAFFKGIEIKREEVVGFFSENCREYFEIRCACHLSGLIFFSLPSHLNEEDIIYFLNITEVKVFFYRNYGGLNLGRIRQQTQVKYFVDLEGRLYQGIFQKGKGFFKQTYKSEAIATFNLSSGTTGKTPKIVQLSGKNWTASLYNYLRSSDMRINKKIRFLSTLPLATAGSTTFLPSMLGGATNIVMQKDFSPQVVAHCIKKYNVTHLYISPSWFLEFFQWCKQNNERFPSLESIILGTEKIPWLRLKEAIVFFGPIFTVGYGMVEALPPLSLLFPRDYYVRGKIRERLLRSVGRILKGVKIKILEGKFTIDGRRGGRILIKSNTVGRGYLEKAGIKEVSFKHKWFYSSDYGFVDREGFLYLLGREEEIIVREGKAYFAQELEDRLYELSFINRCAVIEGNKGIFVFISLRERFNMEKEEARCRVFEFCRRNWDEFLLPYDIIVEESLPINFLGKLDRKQLGRKVEHFKEGDLKIDC